jgi:protocatechuate 3,4-dioxygenase beta subunit
MARRTRLSRRDLLGAGLLLPFGVLVATDRALAGACSATPRLSRGPFFPRDDQADKDVDLTHLPGHEDTARGLVIRVEGRVLDEDCKPVDGALVDLWQADSNGRYSHPADRNPAPRDPDFQGWGQAVTGVDGRCAFRTVKPAAYPRGVVDERPDERMGYRTPHIHFRISRRGFQELTTQMYFAGEALNETDFLLQQVPKADWPKIVLKPHGGAPGDPPSFRFELTIRRA